MNRFATYEEENIHYWTHRAPGYSGVNQEELATDQKRVWGRTIQERIAARFPGRKPGSIRVLDVGTGPGFFAIILARMGYQVTAVDYTASMLEEARRNAGALADKIDFHQMNAEELMFADYSFDVLVTRNVTWNLHDPEKAYSHWTRVLAPGGLLLNFDANWYRYLWDEEAELGHKRDRENLAVSDVRDENAGTDVDAMERCMRVLGRLREIDPDFVLEVTELDMSCFTWNDTSTQRELTEEFVQQFDEKYCQVFSLLMDYAQEGLLDTVVFWGYDDGSSWLNEYPVEGRTNHPLLIDRELKFKSAYWALMNLPQQRAAQAAQEE